MCLGLLELLVCCVWHGTSYACVIDNCCAQKQRKASEEPSDGTTTVTGMPSTGTSSGAVRLRIKQPRLG